MFNMGKRKNTSKISLKEIRNQNSFSYKDRISFLKKWYKKKNYN